MELMQLLDKFISRQETVFWVTFDNKVFKAIETINKESQPSGRIREVFNKILSAAFGWLELLEANTRVCLSHLSWESTDLR